MRKHGDQSQTLGLFFLTVLARMGCFFGCFGLKDGNRRRPSFAPDTASSKNRGTLASQNQLSKLFKCEEEDSLGENLESHGMQVTLKNGDGDDNDKELKDQAKFLKTCGTLLHTPIELRKGSTKRVVQGGDSCKELNWDEKPNQVPLSSVELHGKSEKMLVQEKLASPGEILRSFTPEGQKEDSGICTVSPKVSGSEYSNTLVDSVHAKHKDNALSSVAPEFPLSTTQCKIKSVRFERDPAVGLETSYASLGSSPNNGKYNGGQCYDSPDTEDSTSQLPGLRRSPYATPLNLTDEMQTPGTVYPKQLEKFTTGKNSQVQSQFVHPALNAIDDISQWNALNEDSKTHQAGPSGDVFNLTMAPTPEYLESVRKLQHVLDQRSSQLVEEDFSDQSKRLSLDYARSQNSLILEKPLSGRASDLSPDYVRSQNSVNLFLEKPLSGRAPDVDRPIIGAVAVHWKEEELPKIHLKGWDGNGIPNSTTKYKEDQKVSWHATPFEERLEKALSDERLLPRKLLKGNQILFEEREESDTASSFSSMNREATTVQL